MPNSIQSQKNVSTVLNEDYPSTVLTGDLVTTGSELERVHMAPEGDI